MLWFRKPVAAPSIDLTAEEIAPDAAKPTSRIERARGVVGKSLDMFQADEIALEKEIADRETAHQAKIAELTEELRQTRVCIEGFTANDRILVSGAKVKEPEATIPLPDGRELAVERLVPRMAKRSAAS